MVLFALLNVAYHGAAAPVSIIPKPVSAEFQEGVFYLGAGPYHIRANRGARAEASLVDLELKSDLELALNQTRVRDSAGPITFSLDSNVDTGEEGYALDVTPTSVSVKAKNAAGLFYGGQTLRQLAANGAVPCCHITDAPSYGWRGLLLDVSRHFRPKADIERYLDLMAFHKLNVFHWHLVDDGGWRVEIKKYPELTRRGAWRSQPKESWGGAVLFPEQHSDDEYGGFYTQKDIKEIVAYAAARHITIVPEIEMPGHSLAAINCYPDVACTKPDGSGSVINSNYCPGKEQTFKFLTGVLDEVLTLFPSKFIHIGGDEVDKSTWKTCPDCQARIKSEGLHNEEELQSYFIKRIETYLNSKGRRLIGWDEILEGGLAPNATVMSWRGIEGGMEAAKQGKNAVMCPTSHCYFDYSYAGTPTSRVYSYNPIPEGMTPDQAKLVLGGQGNLWTEWIPTRNRLDEMTWPRAAALAEVFWTPRNEQNWTDFEARLPNEYAWLTRMGIDFMPPAPTSSLSAVVSQQPMTIDFGQNDNSLGAVKLRYTTDGSAPTATSTEYTSPITVDRDEVLKAAYFNWHGTAGDLSTVAVHIGAVDAPSGQLSPGLEVRYYEGKWESMPDFRSLTPIATSTASSIGIESRKRDENYGLVFSGYIDIPEDGIYTFSVTSDDGALLQIAGAAVVDDQASHAPRAATGKIQLTKGRYPFRLSYYQIGGAERLDVKVSESGAAMQEIPAGWLGH